MGKRKVLKPEATDWLFSCSAALPTKQIVATLPTTVEPVTEFSARHWQEPWKVGNDILRIYGYPESYYYEPGQQVSWDSIRDWMFIKCWKDSKLIKNRLEMGVFVGELIIIRECGTEVAVSLAGIAASAALYMRHIQKQRLVTLGRLMVVLVGWTLPVLTARVGGGRVAYSVNPLPEEVCPV